MTDSISEGLDLVSRNNDSKTLEIIVRGTPEHSMSRHDGMHAVEHFDELLTKQVLEGLAQNEGLSVLYRADGNVCLFGKGPATAGRTLLEALQTYTERSPKLVSDGFKDRLGELERAEPVRVSTSVLETRAEGPFGLNLQICTKTGKPHRFKCLGPVNSFPGVMGSGIKVKCLDCMMEDILPSGTPTFQEDSSDLEEDFGGAHHSGKIGGPVSDDLGKIH